VAGRRGAQTRLSAFPDGTPLADIAAATGLTLK
jgi:hypothetical protein